MRKLIALAAIVAATIIAAPAPADAASTPCYVAPLHSRTATHCRASGWILRDKLRVNPHGVISFATLPKCGAVRTFCWANFDRAQDGVATYWVDSRGRQRFVWLEDPRVTGRRGDAIVTSRWLTDAERQNLSTTHGHAPSWWKSCTTDDTTVRCPDGATY